MSNMNPDTSGLRPFNTMPCSESAVIQSAGGVARAEKMRKVKPLKELIQGLRADATVDPLEVAIANLYSNMTNPITPTNEIIKAIQAIHKIIGEKPTDWTGFDREEGHKGYDPAEIAKIHQEMVKLSQEEERKARERGEIK